MNWNPMMGPLGGLLAGQQFKENQLGAGVTLGNPQAQEDYIAQLARALADSGAADDLMGRADALKGSGWIDNSGLAGVAERMFSGYASRKMSEKARSQQADAEGRRLKAEFEIGDQKAAREQDRTEKVTTRERTRRQSLASQMGLSNREAVEFIETGKVPNAARLIPQMTNQGLVGFNPETSEYTEARPAGQRQRQPPQDPYHIDGDVPPQVRAAMQADPAAWESGQSIDIPEQKQPLMPYKDPEIAQRQASADARADEALQLARRGADRADNALTFQQEQVKKKAAAQESQPNAMRQDAINFAAAYIDKSPDEVAKMTPEEIRSAVAAGGRWMAGPVMGRVPGVGPTFNADLDAYSSSAAAKLARINNPTGVVTNADFQAAEKGVFSATKPAEVNADLIYQTLTGGGDPAKAAPKPAPAATPAKVPMYNPKTGEFE